MRGYLRHLQSRWKTWLFLLRRFEATFRRRTGWQFLCCSSKKKLKRSAAFVLLVDDYGEMGISETLSMAELQSYSSSFVLFCRILGIRNRAKARLFRMNKVTHFLSCFQAYARYSPTHILQHLLASGSVYIRYSFMCFRDDLFSE